METIAHFVDKSGLLLTKEALSGGITKDNFYRFVTDNHFEKVAQGVYLSPEAWGDSAFVLHQRCPQAVFSHDEALFYYELIDREPMEQTITIYSGYNTQKLKVSGIKVFTVKKELLTQTKAFTRDEFSRLLFKCHNIIRNNDKLSPEAAFDEISKILFMKYSNWFTGFGFCLGIFLRGLS